MSVAAPTTPKASESVGESESPSPSAVPKIAIEKPKIAGLNMDRLKKPESDSKPKTPRLATGMKTPRDGPGARSAPSLHPALLFAFPKQP